MYARENELHNEKLDKIVAGLCPLTATREAKRDFTRDFTQRNAQSQQIVLELQQYR